MEPQDTPATGVPSARPRRLRGGRCAAAGGTPGRSTTSPKRTRHPCARCARIQKTCCQQAEILVTEGDLARIARHTARSDFWERRAPTDPSYTEPDNDDPNWLRWSMQAGGTRRVLRRLPEGDCTFLGPAGCTLPGDVRPLVCGGCTPGGTPSGGSTASTTVTVPTARVAPPGRTMIQALDMDAAEGLRWHRMLDDEVLELNREAQRQLRCENQLVVIHGATHLFEERGTLEQVAQHAAEWFIEHIPAAARSLR